MKEIPKKINYNTIFFIFILVEFAIFYIISYFSPMENDEYVYSCIFWTGHRITNLLDTIQSMQILYQDWSGRILFCGLFLQSLLTFGKAFTALASALSFSLLGIFAMLLFGGIRNKFERSDFILCVLFYAVLWFFLPSPASIIWIAGSADYLWPFVFCFLFIFPYINMLGKADKTAAFFPYIFPLIAFVAGLSTEIFSELFGLSALFLVIAALKKKVKLPKYLWVGLGCFIAGVIILFLAPGNFKRAAGNSHVQVWEHIKSSFHLLFANAGILIIVFLAVFLLLVLLNRYSKSKKNFTVVYALFIASISSVVMEMCMPEFYLRELIPPFIIILVLILYMAKTLLYPGVLNNKYVFWAAILIVILLLVSQLQVMGIYRDIDAQMSRRDALITADIQKGVKDITVPSLIFPSSKYILKNDLNQDPKRNRLTAQYWGVHSIALSKK